LSNEVSGPSIICRNTTHSGCDDIDMLGAIGTKELMRGDRVEEV
jgi:hypothetical protein